MSKTATDLSGLVKRKKPKPPAYGDDSGFGSGASTPAPEAAAKVNGKRKVEFVDEITSEAKSFGKRARVEDIDEAE